MDAGVIACYRCQVWFLHVDIPFDSDASLCDSSPTQMSDHTTDETPQEPIPAGQRFFDNIFVLLGLGILVMVVLYSGWGMYEILTLPKATLP